MAIRSARLLAYAKLNLDLKVLNRGANGFHDLRSVFQTITLADRIDIAFTPGRKTEILLDSTVAIADNLAARAARFVMEEARVTGKVEMRLRKMIPMGAGMGGGSSDAAAILLGLPVLAGRNLALPALMRIGAALGSDVPYFLLGGAAVALGRGTEVYPLPDFPPRPLLVVETGIHVSTPEAYAALDRASNGKLTEDQVLAYIDSFQSRVWRLGESLSHGRGGMQAENDFEGVVFPKHPQLKSTLKILQKAGAGPARMTGSGSALFGVFTTQEQVRQAESLLAASQAGGQRVHRAGFISRTRYHASWWRQLQEHMDGKEWPPRSRYARSRD